MSFQDVQILYAIYSTQKKANQMFRSQSIYMTFREMSYIFIPFITNIRIYFPVDSIEFDKNYT